MHRNGINFRFFFINGTNCRQKLIKNYVHFASRTQYVQTGKTKAMIKMVSSSSMRLQITNAPNLAPLNEATNELLFCSIYIVVVVNIVVYMQKSVCVQFWFVFHLVGQKAVFALIIITAKSYS